MQVPFLPTFQDRTFEDQSCCPDGPGSLRQVGDQYPWSSLSVPAVEPHRLCVNKHSRALQHAPDWQIIHVGPLVVRLVVGQCRAPADRKDRRQTDAYLLRPGQFGPPEQQHVHYEGPKDGDWHGIGAHSVREFLRNEAGCSNKSRDCHAPGHDDGNDEDDVHKGDEPDAFGNWLVVPSGTFSERKGWKQNETHGSDCKEEDKGYVDAPVSLRRRLIAKSCDRDENPQRDHRNEDREEPVGPHLEAPRLRFRARPAEVGQRRKDDKTSGSDGKE